MAVNTIAQGNISISSINTENTASTSNDLKTLSTTAVSAGTGTPSQMINITPYGMAEFSGYIHETDFGFTDSSSASSNGKHGHNITWSGSIAVPYGTQFPTTCSIIPYLNTKGCRIYFNAAFTDWTSVNFTIIMILLLDLVVVQTRQYYQLDLSRTMVILELRFISATLI